jgi:hypothetical protein
MSNPESFIDEVSEELRKDRMSRLLRRWGWVAVLAVIAIVGLAAWSELSSTRETAAAREFGDAVIAASAVDDAAGALAAVAPSGAGQAALIALLEAGARIEAEPDAARARLLELSEADAVPPIYRDLALMKVMLAGGTGEPGRDAAILEALSAPGAPYRPLALEQQAYLALAAGDAATAVTLLRLLSEEATATAGLRRRAAEMLLTLGAEPA